MNDIVTGIITSDFQVKIRWGWMGFDNASWDQSKWPDIMHPNVKVDVNHDNGTASGKIIAMEALTCTDYSRCQADWVVGKPMEVIVATFLIPHNTPVKASLNRQIKKTGMVGVSIEHGGRKPKRTIGPYVTLTDKPWNGDAWMVTGLVDKSIIPLQYPGLLPASARNLITNQFYTCLQGNWV